MLSRSGHSIFLKVASHTFIGFHDHMASHLQSLTGASNDSKCTAGTLFQKVRGALS